MLKKILLGSAIVIFSVVLFIFYRISTNLDDITINTDNVIPVQPVDTIQISHDTDLPDPQAVTKEENVQEPEKETEDFYTLTIGLDTRGKEFTLNTDSLIVAHVIPQNQTVKLVSIPRDTKVTNPMPNNDIGPSGEFVKINAVFAEGYEHALYASKEDPSLLSGKKVKLGVNRIPEEYISSGIAQLRETINDYLGIHIRYSYLVDFQTVVSLVDAVNGITIDVDRRMIWDDTFDGTHIDLMPGVQKLNGQQALDFARFRQDSRGEAYYSSDLSRGKRQQQVIMALVDKLTGWGSVTKALNLMDIVAANVKTDMPPSVMVSMIKKYYGHIDADSIQSLDFNGEWKSPFIDIDDEDLEQLKNKLTSLDTKAAADAG